MTRFCRCVLLLLSSVVQCNSTMSQAFCNIEHNDFAAAKIILYFAPMGESSAVRQQIVIYYHNPGYVAGDEIRFYSGITKGITALRLLDTFRPSESKGTWETNTAPVDLLYNITSIYKTECLGYFASWSRNDKSYALNCLSTHPDWMGTRKSLFWNKRIQDIFIPGTHNSGSYSEAESQSYTQKLTVTQDHDVFQQLISGARYIDLRPSIYNGSYWVNHGPSHPMNRMDDIIDDVKQFMNNTQEIVILSFKEFPYGFETDDHHRNFNIYLAYAFVNYLLPLHDRAWELTLGDIWELGRRLILSYDYHFTYQSFWPRIMQYWPNARNLEELGSHLKNYRRLDNSPVAAMAEITLDSWTVLKNFPTNLIGTDDGSLRRFATIVAPNITAMYFESLFPFANIVAVDYLDATGIVDVAIEWNDRRLSPCSSYYQLLMLIVRRNHRT